VRRARLALLIIEHKLVVRSLMRLVVVLLLLLLWRLLLLLLLCLTRLLKIIGDYCYRLAVYDFATPKRLFRCVCVPKGDGRCHSLIVSLQVFLQMFLKIRLLRVRFPAILAYVRLQMFRLLVLGNVLEERALVVEAFVARVALEWTIGLVAPRMRLEIRKLRELLNTSRMPALVWLVAGVRANVLLEM
jgi:hypothetical protein